MPQDEHAMDLPWGWWLRAGSAGFEDESGRRWKSVRDAYWQGRLGFPTTRWAAEQQELLLRALTSIHRRRYADVERTQDMFGGDVLFSWFYHCWLSSVGLLDLTDEAAAPGDALGAPLSTEGRSVLLMLQATRDPEWEQLPLAEIIEAIVSAGHGAVEEEREQALRAFERQIGLRRHVFARERVGSSHLITLTSISTSARMPTRRVTWSLSFADRFGRDDLFAWLAQRVECWDDWGQLAYGCGANVLTSHILSLIFARGGL